MMASISGAQTAGRASALFTRWPELATGENAVAVVPVPGKLAMAGLWDVTDGAAAQSLWFDYLSTIGGAQHGMMQTTVDTHAGRYRGVRFARARSTSNAVAMQPGMALYGGQLDVGYAVAGPLFTMAMGGDVIAQLRALTDVALPRKRPRSAAPALAATLAVARAHRDSYVIVVDAPAVRAGFQAGAAAPTPRELAFLGLGFDGDVVVLRAVMPATQLAPLL
jgi:hypothetical protein